MNVAIKVYGATKIREQLSSNDLKKMLGVVGQLVTSRTIERFEDEKDPNGNSWKKKKEDDGNKVLHGLTAQLKRISYTADSKSVKIGPTVDYGIFHQFGTKHLAKRAFLGINEENFTEIETVLAEQLRKNNG